MEEQKTWGEIWRSEFDAIGDNLDLWNRNVIPWMHGLNLVATDIRHDPESLTQYKRLAHAYATKRGWVYDKASDTYVAPSEE
jgi:hypothetical protein